METKLHDRFGNPVPSWFAPYLQDLGGVAYMDVLQRNQVETPVFISSIPIHKENFSYAPGKWTVKEVLIHVIDSERIFGYRALRFARNDKTPVPGFEENDYVPFSNARNRSVESIIDEYESVRHSTMVLFRQFTDEMLSRTGTANNHVISVEACGMVIAGHENHHLRILRERYLNPL
jgi:hypothetical protein